MFRVLVTGGNGQLGQVLKKYSKNYTYDFIFASKNILDISNKKNIIDAVKKNKINVIINCAAYTDSNKAEEDILNAQKLNVMAVKYLAEVSKEFDLKLIHISSDYVYDGKENIPYLEDNNCSPINIYGKTKLDGEKELQEIKPQNSIIIRTSWVYSIFANNFFKTINKLSFEKKELNVVFDQVGTPTLADDLALTILDIIPFIKNENVQIYNYSNEGVISWYDFAKEIVFLNNSKCIISPILSSEYPSLVKRPAYSVMNKNKIKNDFKITIPYWKDSLIKCFNNYKKEGKK